ncbi:BatD family protein [Thiolinea disciformis]|uniref:BatD family protein n=1 Tax=Thiolinea disciformis TaxID=125614 RepID=UPI00035C9ABF|nr:BatD family protein [Thiolinea disciformis]
MVIRRLLLISWLILLSFFGVVQADITVKADREQIAVGDNFTLTFSSDRQVDGAPDFSPLHQYFEILGTGQSSNFQSLNGRVNRFFSWEIELIATKEGKIEIPALNFGSEQSPPLTLTILKEPPASANATKDSVFIEITTEPEQPYVQQQVLVRQRLYHAVQLSSGQASLSHVTWGNGQGDIRQLGDAKYTSEVRNGVRYQVIERRYAAFPRSSGTASLAPTVFEGVIDEDPDPNDIFGMSGKLVRRVSKPVSFQVLPQPSQIKGDWLPAKSVTLNAYWEPTKTTIKAGEPVILTLAIMADGLMAEQLPALKIQTPAGLKAYSDKPSFENKGNTGSVVGVRQEKWTVVGTADGNVVWPEISLNWWSTEKNRPEVARLPARTLKISGAGVAVEQLPAPAKTGTSVPEESSTDAALPAETPKTVAELAAPVLKTGRLYWPQLVALSLGLLGFGVVLFTLKRAWQHQDVSDDISFQKLGVKSRSNTWAVLQHACQRNDAPVALDALQSWLKEASGLNPPTLANLRMSAPTVLQKELDSLNAALYAPKQAVSWQGQGLYQALYNFRQTLVAQDVRESESELAAMYPE